MRRASRQKNDSRMKPDDIKELLGEDWKKVESYIRESLSSDIDLLERTNSMILSHSGKQLRPLLSVLVAAACSGGRPTEDSYRYAAASELVHNATLLHDDVADSSDQRRGIPTIRSIMGPSVSVLLGDYWLVKGMNLILSASVGTERVIRIFSKTFSDLAEGEMLQLEKAAACDTDESDYIRIIFSKTASLFVAAALSAAISVGAPENMEKAVDAYAESLGIAFQIRDDILDYSDSPDIGKPVGVDILEKKITMPLLGALANAPKDEAEKMRRMISEVQDNPGIRDEVMAFVRRYDGVAYAEMKLDGYIRDAVTALDVLPDTRYRQQLIDMAGYVGVRSK